MVATRGQDPLRETLPRVAVRRPGLEARLDLIEAGGLALVVAPAGSGKSVLVRQWVAARPDVTAAPLSLRPGHDDAVLLAHDLVEVLRPVAPQVGGSLTGLVPDGGNVLGQAFLGALLERLARAPEGTVLVVEDLHVLTNHALVADLGDLVAGLPPSVRCVVTTRRDPPWPLAPSRLDGRVVELRAADLAFTAPEAAELLGGVSGRALTDDQVLALHDRTEGWVAGLQLAALSLRSAPDVAGQIDAFAGNDRLVAEYLVEEVVGQLEPDLRSFLLQSSVLDWLSADLCDAVTGRSDSRAVLDDLEQRSLFLVALDRVGETYRYHHLFADLLRYRLRAEDPTLVPTLHLRAARWLLEAGRTDEAIEHLLVAGEREQTFEVIAQVGHRFFERGQSATLVRWLSATGAGDVTAPAVMGVNLMAAQVAADHAPAAAETHRRLLRRSDLTTGERVAADALSTTFVFRDLAPEVVLSTVQRVREELSVLGESDVVDFLGIGGLESIRLMVEYDAAVAHFLRGDLEQAASGLGHALTLPGIGYPIWKTYVLGSLALVRAWSGRCTEALQLAEAAAAAAAGVGITHHAALVHASMAIALVHVDRAEPDLAGPALAECDLQNRRRSSAVVNLDLQRNLVARRAALTHGPAATLDLLRAPAASAIESPVLSGARAGLELRLLVGTGRLVDAHAVLEQRSGAPGLEAARIDLALATGDVTLAREVLEQWQTAPHDLRAFLGRQLRRAVVLAGEGDEPTAQEALAVAVAVAQPEHLRWPFLEVPAALRLLRRGALRRSEFADPALAVLAHRIDGTDRVDGGLVEHLTERELAVLALLPRRMKQEDIAGELYVTMNTLKTHLRAIYRKLGVTGRDEAVARAQDLGLLT